MHRKCEYERKPPPRKTTLPVEPQRSSQGRILTRLWFCPCCLLSVQKSPSGCRYSAMNSNHDGNYSAYRPVLLSLVPSFLLGSRDLCSERFDGIALPLTCAGLGMCFLSVVFPNANVLLCSSAPLPLWGNPAVSPADHPNPSRSYFTI